MKRQILSLILAASMILPLAACSKGEGSSQASSAQGSSVSAGSTDGKLDAKGETLKVWMPTFADADGKITDKEFWTRELKPLTQETGCSVEVEIVPWDSYEEKYLAGVTSGKGPDVGYMYMEMFYDYIHKNLIDNVDQYFTDSDKANYLYYKLGNIQGGQYGLPIVVGNPRILIGNKSLLKKAGITAMPKTWDDLVADSKKIMEKEPGVTPFLQSWGNPQYGVLNESYWPFFWSAGAQIVDKDGNMKINSKEALQATQFLYDLKNKDKILPDSCTSNADNIATFKEGKTAFTVVASSNALKISNIDWDFTTVLASPNGGQKTFVAADCLVMFNSAKNKQLAAKAMKLMTSTEVMSRFHSEVSSQPPITKDEKYTGDNRFNELYLKEGDKLETLPVFEGSAAFYDIFYKNLQQMMIGKMSPSEVLSQSVDYYNNNIKDS